MTSHYMISILVNVLEITKVPIYYDIDHPNTYHFRGDDFRQDFARLGMLSALFPSVPVIILTATASIKDRTIIKKTLHIKNHIEVVVSPNRPNIFYNKIFRVGPDFESYESILQPIAEDLRKETVNYPLTIVYMNLKWCGFAYKLFDRILGDNQYYPEDAARIPENRIFSQFHAPQTTKMKEQILKELSTPSSKIRIVFATVAMGMGVDIPSIRCVIHIGPPCIVREYMQETGRAGRDGQSSTAVLYYNNVDIAVNKKKIGEEIREYCHLENECLRKYLLQCLDAEIPDNKGFDAFSCCSNCDK